MNTEDISSYDIQVSDSCNLNCEHCIMGKSMTGKQVDFNKIKEFLLKRKSVKEIHLGGGEPLLSNPNKILDLIKSFPGVYWKLTTNLIYDIDPVRLEILKSIDKLYTSFDLNIRFKSISNLLKWKSNVKKLVSHGIPVNLFISITKYTVSKDPKKFISFFDHLEVNEYKYILLASAGNATTNKDILVSKDEYIEWMDRVLDLGDTLRNQTIDLIRYKNITNCHYGRTMLSVNTQGQVIHCGINPVKDSNCIVHDDCLMCKDFKYCGGRCVLMPCMFNKKIYERVREIRNDYFY